MVLLLVISAIDGCVLTCIKGSVISDRLMDEWVQACLDRPACKARRQR